MAGAKPGHDRTTSTRLALVKRRRADRPPPGEGAYGSLHADDAGAARKDAHVGAPHADIAPLTDPVGAGALIGAGAAVIDRAAAGAHRDRLALLPYADRR